MMCVTNEPLVPGTLPQIVGMTSSAKALLAMIGQLLAMIGHSLAMIGHLSATFAGNWLALIIPQ